MCAFAAFFAIESPSKKSALALIPNVTIYAKLTTKGKLFYCPTLYRKKSVCVVRFCSGLVGSGVLIKQEKREVSSLKRKKCVCVFCHFSISRTQKKKFKNFVKFRMSTTFIITFAMCGSGGLFCCCCCSSSRPNTSFPTQRRQFDPQKPSCREWKGWHSFRRTFPSSFSCSSFY